MSGRPCEASEHMEQVALVKWWLLLCKSGRLGEAPPLLFAIPNGGARSVITGARLRAEGVTPGIPDLCLALPGGQAHGLFIELKKQHGGVVSPAQKAVMHRLETYGYRCIVAHGWREAATEITGYLDLPVP